MSDLGHPQEDHGVEEVQRSEGAVLLYSDWVDREGVVGLFVVVGSDHLGLDHLSDHEVAGVKYTNKCPLQIRILQK